MSGSARAAVILAAGRGTRMQRAHDASDLDPAQRAMADRGLKAMVPDVRGRPFLDHIFSSAADAGITEIGLVVSPLQAELFHHLEQHPPRRLHVEYILQPEAHGTADAVRLSEAWVGERNFLVFNADNLYPVAALHALVTLGEPGLIAFDADALVAESNIPAERIAAFAIVEVDRSGYLRHITEKPSHDRRLTTHDPISMNLWRFDRSIFAACRDVPRSTRGEFELPEAVALHLQNGGRLRAVNFRGGVLDLSSRGDIAAVAHELGNRQPTT